MKILPDVCIDWQHLGHIGCGGSEDSPGLALYIGMVESYDRDAYDYMHKVNATGAGWNVAPDRCYLAFPKEKLNVR